MNRSALFLSVGALLLVSACSKQEAANTAPAQDTLPPAEQTLPPSDSATPESTPPATDPGAATPNSDSATTPPADSGTADPAAPPPRQ
jgi:hypothetical protein